MMLEKPESNCKMKVLVVTATYPPMTSGGADYAFRLNQLLADRGLEVHVLTSKIENLVTQEGLHIYPEIKSWLWSDLPKLLHAIYTIKPDVINLHFAGILYNDHPMITFLPTIAKWLLPGVKVVTLIEAPVGVRAYVHGLPVRGLHKIMANSIAKVDYSFGTILPDSDAIIFLSEWQRLRAFDYYPNILDKSAIIPPPPLMPVVEGDRQVLRRQGRASLNLSDEDFVIAYLGYVYPCKGLETLLAAFKRVIENNHNCRLVIIGGTPEIVLKSMDRQNYLLEIKALANELGIASKIIWTGGFAIDSTEPSLFLRAADLSVLPFDLGVTLNNSSFAGVAAHGLPIITTRGEILEQPFVDRDNVWLCKPKDADCLAQAIEQLMASSHLRFKLGEASFKLAQECFSWPKACDRTVAVFEGKL